LEDERQDCCRILNEYDRNQPEIVLIREELEILKVKYTRMWKHNAFKWISDLAEDEYAYWNAYITSWNEKVASVLEVMQEEERTEAVFNHARIIKEKEERTARLNELCQEIETRKDKIKKMHFNTNQPRT
jgi:hypothetical protein